jgi:predicted small integral membrane protein
MSVAVVLQDERGNQEKIVSDIYGDLMELWPLGNPSFPLLQYVDTYGDAVFNRLQMNQLLIELESLGLVTENEKAKNLLNEIVTLVLQCRDNSHLYIRFRGD